MSMLLMTMALAWTSCDDDDEVVVTPPSIQVTTPALSEDNTKAVVEVTPSAETENWYWKCELQGENNGAFTKVTGNESQKLEISVELDRYYTLSVYAENEFGKDAVKKDFIFRADELMDELVEIEVKNVSPFSMDVFVKKSAKCSKYVIAAIPKEIYGEAGDADHESGWDPVYNENDFVEMAELSLNPNKDYPNQPFNWSDKDAYFTEKTLAKNKLAHESDSEGVNLMKTPRWNIAVYALDAEGTPSVIVKYVELPEPEVNGNVKVDIEFSAISMTGFNAWFGAEDNCSRIITGYFNNDDPENAAFVDMTDEEKKEFLVALGTKIPEPYNISFTNTYSQAVGEHIYPGISYTVFAIAIDKEGKINPSWVEVTTKTPETPGTGDFVETGIVLGEQTSHLKVPVKEITVTENVKAIRILFCTAGSAPATNTMPWVFADVDMNKEIGYWDEYSVNPDQKPRELSIPNHWGEPYVLWAATVDMDGKVSEPKQLAYIETKTEDDFNQGGEENGIFNGIGEATLEITSITDDQWDKWTKYVNYTVTKGNNTQKAYSFITSSGDVKKEELLDRLTGQFEKYPNITTGGLIKEINFNAEGKADFSNLGMMKYDSQYGGDVIVIVTVDSNEKLKITQYYIAGDTAAKTFNGTFE